MPSIVVAMLCPESEKAGVRRLFMFAPDGPERHYVFTTRGDSANDSKRADSQRELIIGTKRVAFINRYYPPDGSPTGEAACELASHLAKRDLEIHAVFASTSYKERTSGMEPVGELHAVRAWPRGRPGLLRLLSSLFEGLGLCFRAFVLRPDVVVVLTDPPLLHLWAGLIFRFSRARWIYWSLDLYPEAFEAAGLVGRRHIAYRFLSSAVRHNSPDMLIALGEKQAERILTGFTRPVEHVCLPPGIIEMPHAGPSPSWRSERHLHFGYFGNLGAAHSASFVIALARSLDPARHRLILSPTGVKAREVLEAVSGNEAVVLLDRLPLSQMSHIDVHMVSLLPHWTDLCVPSKAVTAICCGRPILFHGVAESDTWQTLGSAGWLLDARDPPSLASRLGQLIGSLDRDEIERKASAAGTLGDGLRSRKAEAFAAISGWIVEGGAQRPASSR